MASPLGQDIMDQRILMRRSMQAALAAVTVAIGLLAAAVHRLHEAGMITSSPQKLIAQGTNWRFLNELKREMKG